MPPGDARRVVFRSRAEETLTSLAAWLEIPRAQLAAWNPTLEIEALSTGTPVRAWLSPRELRELRRRKRPGSVLRDAGLTREELQAPSTSGTSDLPEQPALLASSTTDSLPAPASAVASSSRTSSSRATSLPQRRQQARSESVGATNRGRLVGAVQLPTPHPSFVLARPDEAWTTRHIAALLVDALDQFQRASSYGRPLAVASISRQRGGKLPPHRSHQSGRDVDIRLPVRDKSRALTYKASHRAEIDWDAAWILVRELLETGEVRYIFLERSGQQKLRRAARKAGAPEQQLDAWIQYHPEGDRRAAIVRHAKGHVGHIHVRFRCAEAERRCEER